MDSPDQEKSMENTETLAALSRGMADAVAKVGRSVVRVHGRRRHPGSGVVYGEDLVLTAGHGLERGGGLSVGTGGGGALPGGAGGGGAPARRWGGEGRADLARRRGAGPGRRAAGDFRHRELGGGPDPDAPRTEVGALHPDGRLAL